MSLIEAVALEQYVAATITSIESDHRQYELGFLDEQHWHRNISNLKCWLSDPVFREMIRPFDFRESFSSLLIELAEEANSAPSSCWDMDTYYDNFK